eukprot:3306283-Rhodomonas_salina.1
MVVVVMVVVVVMRMQMMRMLMLMLVRKLTRVLARRIIETLPPQQLETAAELFIEWQQPVEFNGWKLLLPAQQTPGEVARFAAWGVREGEEDESCLLRQHRGACEMEVADSVDEEEGERTVLVDLRPTAGQWISWVVLPIFQVPAALFLRVCSHVLHRHVRRRSTLVQRRLALMHADLLTARF